MSTTPVRLSPNMSFAQLVNALNQNFSLDQNSTRTQILTDKSGVKRIIIGILPDGTSGIVVSKPGVDVVKLFQ